MQEGVVDMVDSIHGELRKPSTTAEKATEIAANLRAKKQNRPVRKNVKLTPNHSRPALGRFPSLRLSA